jgi:hypothetical protein
MRSLDYSNNIPDNIFSEKELDEIILKVGSLLSILHNKKTNQVKLLLATLQDEVFAKCFMELTGINNLQLLVGSIVRRYPTLYKSKVIQKELGVTNDRKRKKNI